MSWELIFTAIFIVCTMDLLRRYLPAPVSFDSRRAHNDDHFAHYQSWP
jgi:hypothetical protein